MLLFAAWAIMALVRAKLLPGAAAIKPATMPPGTRPGRAGPLLMPPCCCMTVSRAEVLGDAASGSIVAAWLAAIGRTRGAPWQGWRAGQERWLFNARPWLCSPCIASVSEKAPVNSARNAGWRARQGRVATGCSMQAGAAAV
jgi:hypothetical protein